MASKFRLVRKLIIVVIVIGGVVFGLARYHFILMDTKVKVLKKAALGWEYTFVDARGEKQYKLFLNPTLVKAGFKDLFEEGVVTIGQ